MKSRSSLLGVETGTADPNKKRSGVWVRWSEGDGHWAPRGHSVAGPGQWFPRFGTQDNLLGYGKKI